MRGSAGSWASIPARRCRLLPESSTGCSWCSSGIGNARSSSPHGIPEVPSGETIVGTNLCAGQAALVAGGCLTLIPASLGAALLARKPGVEEESAESRRSGA